MTKELIVLFQPLKAGTTIIIATIASEDFYLGASALVLVLVGYWTRKGFFGKELLGHA
jgi:hypothetical protein